MPVENFGIAPCTRCMVNGIFFEVYQAKCIGQDWASLSLRDAVLHERRTYLRYGDVEPTDRYDDIAAIYLVCAIRNKDGVDIEERFSVRFISGENMSLEEAGNLLSHRLIDVTFFTDKHRKMSFASRACGGINTSKVEHGKIANTAIPKMISTPYAFAFSIDHFFRFTIEGSQSGHLLAIIREEVYRHSLSTSVLGYRVPLFICADIFPEWKNEGSVCMDRTMETFRYPRYFFEYNELRILFRELIESRRLSPSTLAQYIGGENTVTELISGVRMNAEWTRDLGMLLIQNGIIADSTISGEELRELINERVPDGPKLRILSRTTWDEDFKKLMLRIK